MFNKKRYLTIGVLLSFSHLIASATPTSLLIFNEQNKQNAINSAQQVALQIIQSNLTISAKEQGEFNISSCQAEYYKKDDVWLCYESGISLTGDLFKRNYYSVAKFVNEKFNGDLVSYTIIPQLNSYVEPVIVFKYKKAK